MKMYIFGLGGSENYAQEVSSFLDVPLSEHKETQFEDGEIYMRSTENIRGGDIFVISSLYTDDKHSVGDKLTALMFFLGSLSDASASRITVVAPYLSHSRQDRKTESRAPIATKYIAKALEAAGADRLLTMDIHNLSALQNSFRIPTDNLEAKLLFIDYLTGVDKKGKKIESHFHTPLPKASELVVLSPDSGGASRTRKFRESLEKRIGASVEMAYFDKERVHGSVSTVKGNKIIGDVNGKDVIIIDDMISSGRTINIASEAVRKNGGRIHAVCASHGLFTGKANQNLFGIPIIVTDTIRPFRVEESGLDISIVKTTKIFASAIRRTRDDAGSISELLED